MQVTYAIINDNHAVFGKNMILEITLGIEEMDPI